MASPEFRRSRFSSTKSQETSSPEAQLAIAIPSWESCERIGNRKTVAVGWELKTVAIPVVAPDGSSSVYRTWAATGALQLSLAYPDTNADSFVVGQTKGAASNKRKMAVEPNIRSKGCNSVAAGARNRSVVNCPPNVSEHRFSDGATLVTRRTD